MSDLRSDLRYDPIVVSAESTVVAEYVSETAAERCIGHLVLFSLTWYFHCAVKMAMG